MSVLLINGSPRKGVTYNILKQLNEEITPDQPQNQSIIN